MDELLDLGLHGGGDEFGGVVADNVQTFYKQYVTPLLHPGQKLVLVPASFSSDVNHKCDKYAVAAQLIK